MMATTSYPYHPPIVVLTEYTGAFKMSSVIVFSSWFGQIPRIGGGVGYHTSGVFALLFWWCAVAR